MVDRPRQWFAIPVGEWFRTDIGAMRELLMERVVEPAMAGGEPFGELHDTLGFRTRFVVRLAVEHFAASGMPTPSGAARVTPRDHSQRLYLLRVPAVRGNRRERANRSVGGNA